MSNLIKKEELAEISGLHVGDGYLRNDGKRRELDISGGVEEIEFYNKHVTPLFEKHFNLKIKNRHFKSRNTYGFVIRDREIIEQMHNLGFPYGKKTTIVKAPKFVLNSEENMKYFLRGLFDTDGCLTFDKQHKQKHYYPRIIISTCSKRLKRDISEMLNKLDIKHCNQEYQSKKESENRKYITWIRGQNEVEKWFKLIGSKNASKYSKYQIWKKYGFCPTNTSYKERKQILKGEVNPNKLYGPVTQPG